MEVRRCALEDLERLRELWPTPDDVAGSHYAEQHDGHALFIVAWDSQEPLGWAVVHWDGCIGGNARAAVPVCAEILHLHVRAEHRNRGVGSTLVGAAERAISDRGLSHAGLSVGADNIDAARLYERLGYQRTHITDISAYSWRDKDGTVHHERELNELLLKPLAPGH
jgi:ribosomal protein S18 acetylase RimI-like enzyme